MKKTIKLIPAIVMLLVSAILVSTSTYAWFSMNNRVTVTGMTITTKVSSNLLIAGDVLSSTVKRNENAFTTDLVQGVNALLEPVSTTTGKAFFYTKNALASGDAKDDSEYIAYNAAEVPTSGELASFNAYYATTDAVGYVDYVFQLKAVNADTQNTKPIKVTKLDLTYNNTTDGNKAFRVAFFVEDMGENGTTVNSGSGTLKSIYAVSDAANFSNVGDTDYAISAANTAPTAVSTNYNAVTTLVDAVPAGKTNYYKVVARLWLEGEDTTCNNTTFAKLTDNWKLDIDIKLDTSTETNTNVTALTMQTQTHADVALYNVTFSGITGIDRLNGKYKQGDVVYLTKAEADQVSSVAGSAATIVPTWNGDAWSITLSTLSADGTVTITTP